MVGFIVVIIVEIVWIKLKIFGLGGFEDVISFSIFGVVLGVGLSLVVDFSYVVVLWVGVGFEMIEEM